ncbi:MAG: ABC transporter ATP-binding protein, partial [Flavobacteriaceae bacterium]|nr:ABC transporter ATP-binding protein [Flavobacteriaceae bacterium]
VGASGAGKTTLLHLLSTLEKPDKNPDTLLNVLGEDIVKLKGDRLSAFRNRHIGFVFQFHQLLPEFTALENICLPAFIKGLSRPEAEQKALKWLEILNLTHRKDHKPDALSGGEQQRVAIARALINDPQLIFADEPSGNLDSKNAEDLHQLFFNLRDEFGYTFVLVTHNRGLADLADRKLTMLDGKIVSEG